MVSKAIVGGTRVCTVVILLALITMAATLPLALAQQAIAQELMDGPYVDRLEFYVIEDGDQQVLALQNDDVDLIGNRLSPEFAAELADASDIEVVSTLRNGYGYVTIDCNTYPYNITAFRRALAYAVDKEWISNNVWSGFSVPLDSCVPQINPFSAEGQLDYSYYESDIEEANRLLDIAGFDDVDMDGFREAPNGSDFEFELCFSAYSPIAEKTCEAFANALETLNVDFYLNPDNICFHCRLNSQQPYGLFFLSYSFSNFDVDWLAYEFWSEYADEQSWNYPNFRNATYDSWREQLLHSMDYSEVLEAALEMQKIIAYECPIIICYENYLLSAYRTDRFEGFVNDVFEGARSSWSNFKVRLKSSQGGPFGGTLRRSIPFDIDTFNIMSASSGYTIDILDELYDSLIMQDPEGRDTLWLAKSYTTETHDDNPAVTAGNTRITFELADNATWSDGRPLTAEDAAFTLNFYREAPGNRYKRDLQELSAAYAIANNTLIVEFLSESFWHLHSVAYKPILPKHILKEIDMDNWAQWDPRPSETDLVTSGPFVISEYEPGEYISLIPNPTFFNPPRDSTDHNTSTSPFLLGPWLSSIFTGFTVGSLVVIVGAIVLWETEYLRPAKDKWDDALP